MPDLRNAAVRVVYQDIAIAIYDLTYILKSYRTELENLYQRPTDHVEPITPTPGMSQAQRCDDYVASSAAFGGVTSIVSISTNIHTDRAVAVKRIQRTRGNGLSINQEICTVHSLNHANMFKFADVNYPSGDEFTFVTSNEDKCNEAVVFIEPLATSTTKGRVHALGEAGLG